MGDLDHAVQRHVFDDLEFPQLSLCDLGNGSGRGSPSSSDRPVCARSGCEAAEPVLPRLGLGRPGRGRRSTARWRRPCRCSRGSACTSRRRYACPQRLAPITNSMVPSTRSIPAAEAARRLTVRNVRSRRPPLRSAWPTESSLIGPGMNTMPVAVRGEAVRAYSNQRRADRC